MTGPYSVSDASRPVRRRSRMYAVDAAHGVLQWIFGGWTGGDGTGCNKKGLLFSHGRV